MKKITFKIAAVLFIALSAFQSQAQEYEEWTKDGWYTIGIPGQDLFMTINPTTLVVEWSAKLTGADAARQEWAIVAHRYPVPGVSGGASFMEITATIPGVGNFTMTTNSTEEDGKNVTLAVKAGDPKQIENDTDLSGKDHFQRRKTGTNRGGNDALFFKLPWDGGSRFGVEPTAAGEPVQFDGGGTDKLEFKFVRDVVLSTNNFDANSLSISNPVNNQLTVQGDVSKVSQVTIYSVLGSQVFSKTFNNESTINFDVSSLTSGMYIVKIKGDGGSFTKKIIKE